MSKKCIYIWAKRRCSGTTLRILCTALVAWGGYMVAPKSSDAGMTAPFIVRNDRGGDVETRAKQIQNLAARQARVEIRGKQCLSSCTMFLGAPDVCVDPGTRFGFHGPSDQGRPLPAHRFEYWSQVIAAHYPPNLAKWYMEKARHLTHGYYFLTGAQLIQMGVRRCDDEVGP